MVKHRKLRPSGNSRKPFAEQIRDIFNDNFRTFFNHRQIARKIGAKNEMQKKEVVAILESLLKEGFLEQDSPGRYRRNLADMVLAGTFTRQHGRLLVQPDNDGTLLYVSEANALHALHGDRVEYAAISHGKYRGEARILDVVERRGKQQVVGTVEALGRKEYALRVDNRAFDNRVYLSATHLHGAKAGEKVVARLLDWVIYDDSPTGEVVEILGASGENDTEMHAILAEFGLPTRYPEELEKEADKIDDKISAEEIARREDFRNVTTFTIDPYDAKDFDDALSLRLLSENRWEIGVHIADVTHYIKPGTPIDREAYRRGTSVYLVDRTVPMLPERLCNGICSLRPQEDKLCFSVVFEMDTDANVLASRIVRTVIRSDRRFTYEEAQEIIETGTGDCAEQITTLNRLAVILRRRRFEKGAIDFDRQEMKFIIDEKGRPVGIFNKVSEDAHKLIEEFMLLANRTVAERIGKVQKRETPKPFVYRVHDNPDPEKMTELSTFVRRLGLTLQPAGTRAEVADSINSMLKHVHGAPEENLVSMLTIRTMAKAVYTTRNIGHYGLAFDYYTHFTSPIRRYPDMMVHRLLERYLIDNGRAVDADELEDRCVHASDMEQLAANAERASIKYKQAEYLSERLGQVFDGTISGISERGIFVEIDENKCEGFISVRDLDDDYYTFDEASYCLCGRRSRRIYRLGDPMRIIIAKVDIERRQIDFVPEEKGLAPARTFAPNRGKRILSPKEFGLRKAKKKHRL